MEIPVPIQPSWLRRPAPVGFPGLAAPTRLFDQRFGEGLLEAELAALCPQALAPYYLRAPSVALPTDPGPGEVTLAKGHFSVLLDVKHFSPEEITVKVVGDHMEVHARHEERPDEHGFISREFHRRYRLPEGVDPAAVTSGLSPEGILSIQAAAPGTPTAERTVPIAQGPQAGAK
ncbi:heat shock protein beta-6 isoform X2 [Monodelphis domestica]|uniref:heat shock protein beta-6 isoform X2 n=1 Tax=Monodelphis domestica TaxID=13616 RepID=UPI0024E26505|nr:heat shock protein beta-6 isoform X2 [Monodelphis domestica]